MPSKIATLVLFLSIVSAVHSFCVLKTSSRNGLKSTTLSMTSAGRFRKFFASAALSVAFTADFSGSREIFSFTPSAAHARGTEFMPVKLCYLTTSFE